MINNVRIGGVFTGRSIFVFRSFLNLYQSKLVLMQPWKRCIGVSFSGWQKEKKQTWNLVKSKEFLFFSVTQALFLLGFSWSSDTITVSNKKNTKRAYQCIWNNYIIFTQKCYNFFTLSMWVVYTHICV